MFLNTNRRRRRHRHYYIPYVLLLVCLLGGSKRTLCNGDVINYENAYDDAEPERNVFLTKKIFNKLDGIAHLLSSPSTTHVITTAPLPKSNLNIFNEFNDMNQNQNRDKIVLFNIGDSQPSTRGKNSFRLDFNQETINYCHFDPLLLSDKKRKHENNLRSDADENVGFHLNVYLNGDYFNETSKVTGKCRIFNAL